MCGIAGVLYSQAALSRESLELLVNEMGQTLHHRGPDHGDNWIDAEAGIGLSHRRLAIVDLSPSGNQPMLSRNKRYVISFNGEIYNFKEIRSDLEKNGVNFNGHSDTEVLLESIAYQGLAATLLRVNGMFAFALWDRESRKLVLARDRFGKKPLFYGSFGKALVFGSEIKALRKHPEFVDEIDRGALAQFIQFNWLDGPNSIYKKVKKLQPGSYIEISSENIFEKIKPEIYWSAENIANKASEYSFKGSYKEAVDQLEAVIKSSVSRRMIADVELGALLSGGIDSSLVVSMMQATTTTNVKTFSIGFNEVTHNEAYHAKKIANYLQTDHTELYVTPTECMDIIPQLPAMFDEPLGDASQIPTYLVSKLANNHVKVVLSGDGGDELFAGYTRYFRCMNHWKNHQRVPESIRPLLAQGMNGLAQIFWYLLANIKTNPDLKGWRRFGMRLEKRARRIDASSPLELFVCMMERYSEIENLVLAEQDSNSMLLDNNLWPEVDGEIHKMMLIDTLSYLPNDILVKVDRASMATSLEARAPLLDREVFEFAWRIPFQMKVDGQGGKRILRDLLLKYLPNDLISQKKMGFGVPIGNWLRGPLKEWALEMLSEIDKEQKRYLEPNIVREIWKQHNSGLYDHSKLLWSILMFQSWLNEQQGR